MLAGAQDSFGTLAPQLIHFFTQVTVYTALGEAKAVISVQRSTMPKSQRELLLEVSDKNLAMSSRKTEVDARRSEEAWSL